MRRLLILVCVLGLLAGCRTKVKAAPSPIGVDLDADLSAGAPDPCAPECCEPCKLGCWDPSPCRNTYLDATMSFLPNVGVGVGAGRVVRRTPRQTWSVELSGTYQFLDDEDFADDGNPAAGDWFQLRAGFKTSSSPRSRRHFTKRFGAVLLDASGTPNIIEDPGTYYGVYGGLGFETDLSPTLTVGPELSLMVLSHTDEFKVARPVPQLNWHFIWWLGGGRGTCLPRAPYGEVYVGATALLSPGLGGGVEFGQVFSRSSLATWSFELMTGFQDGGDTLAFEGEGDWAQIRGGVKASFQPCKCGHFTARAGATWLRSTAANEFLTGTGDYVGAYLGAGYEWDIGRRFATGPELTLLGVAKESSSEFDFVPQFNWHFIFKL